METITQSTALKERTPDDGRALLERFPNARRSYVANTFLYAVRAGAQTPFQVLAAVNETLTETIVRARRWNHLSDTVQRTENAHALLLEHHAEAYTFAEWCISWEKLTPAEKERQRAVKSEPHRRAYMEQKPASDKQVAYVRALGFTGEITSSAHASQLIDQLRNGRGKGHLS